uniref:Receptor kinase-like protein Xa21 n=1 Tax=Oryza nivara TaxID=4536 RepID=A0A0E0G2R3_ORYNI
MTHLSGPIPASLANMSKLEMIYLVATGLTGVVPSFGLLPNLRDLDLAYNHLEAGDWSFLSSLANCTQLKKWLWLKQNKIYGIIPSEIGNLRSLTILYMDNNLFSGHIPPSIGNLSNLQILSFALNDLFGEIPDYIGNLAQLIEFHIDGNNFSGSIPSSLWHWKHLEKLDISDNSFFGYIPPAVGNLSSIRDLIFARNNFFGHIPSTVGNLSNLSILSFAQNNLFGHIPEFVGNLVKLTNLFLHGNSFTKASHSTNSKMIRLFAPCPKLIPLLAIFFISCSLPLAISDDTDTDREALLCFKSSRPISLEYRNIRQVRASSYILAISKIASLTALSTNSKMIRLFAPCPKLIPLLAIFIISCSLPLAISDDTDTDREALLCFKSQISDPNGALSSWTNTTQNFCNWQGVSCNNTQTQLRVMALNVSSKGLGGSIPPCIGNLSSIASLDLSSNAFLGKIPSELGRLGQISYLNLSINSLVGRIPDELSSCSNLQVLGLWNNSLQGEIPPSLTQCTHLQQVILYNNKLEGSIPTGFGTLRELKTLDLSNNALTGTIPSNGVFGNASRVILDGNYRLCANAPGYSLPLCPESGSQIKSKSTVLKIVIPIVVSAVVISLLCLTIVLMKRRKEEPNQQHSSVNLRKISYEDIAKATDGFSATNLVGLGSFGAVYKGLLTFEDNPVAIKVFNLNKYGAPTSFNAECEALRYIRHRNLVKIITLCSTVDPNGYDFKALVFQYMPNGSLEMWLHPEDHGHGKQRFLTLGERINVALDIAYALDYLHNQCVSPLIHCDMKPSNVLLDLEMTAYVSDFGLARFMCANSTAAPGNSTSLADLKGSIGYIAPEYGMGAQISTRGDVYSYGVLLLEILTGKRPTDEKFKDGRSLHELVDTAFPHRVTEILDPNMLHNDLDGGNSEMMQSCVLPLVKLALMCSMASPKDRLGMVQVSTEIHSIKQEFLDLSSGGKIV